MRPKGWGSPECLDSGAARSRGARLRRVGAAPCRGLLGSCRPQRAGPLHRAVSSPKQHGCSALTYPNTAGEAR